MIFLPPPYLTPSSLPRTISSFFVSLQYISTLDIPIPLLRLDPSSALITFTSFPALLFSSSSYPHPRITYEYTRRRPYSTRRYELRCATSVTATSTSLQDTALYVIRHEHLTIRLTPTQLSCRIAQRLYKASLHQTDVLFF
jgi:hypothetical protein